MARLTLLLTRATRFATLTQSALHPDAFAKVDEEPSAPPGGSQIVYELDLVRWSYAADRFQFHDSPFFDEKVGYVRADYLSLVSSFNPRLWGEVETCRPQFDGQGILVDSLQVPRSKMVVDLKGASNDSLGQFVVCQHWLQVHQSCPSCKSCPLTPVSR